jgi:hypothetical protein
MTILPCSQNPGLSVYSTMPWAYARFAAVMVLILAASPADAVTCTAESSERRVALLELYTSEGCDSCPPADRWVSGLVERGLGPERVVILGFHVDYWNYLGWRDPYAKSEYSQRQRAASQRNQARVVYTPQLLLDGKDYRRGAFREDFAGRVGALNRAAPKARIRLKMSVGDADTLSIEGTVAVGAPERNDTRAYLALYENNLSSAVTSGENRGKRLRHDNVVRELAGPFAMDAQGSVMLAHRFKLAPGWKPANLHVAAFAQNERTGEVLQALATATCR